MRHLSPPQSLADQVYETVLDALCDGTYRPGERVTQEEIAERLNVSRQPVTHALAVLKAQGFLAVSGRQGLTVAPVDPALVRCIYELRSGLEPVAVELGCARLSPALIAEGRRIILRGYEGVASGNRADILKSDMAFHSFLCDLSGNPLIGDTMRLHWRHLARGMGEVLTLPGASVETWQEHNLILDMMIRGDSAAAATLMRAHLISAFDRVTASTRSGEDR